MKNVKFYSLTLLTLAAFSAGASIRYEAKKEIPEGLKQNISQMVNAAGLQDFDIVAGTTDAPAICEVLKKNFPQKKLRDDGFFLIIDGKKITVGSDFPRGIIYGLTRAAEKLSNYSPARSMEHNEIVPEAAKSDIKHRELSNPVFNDRSFNWCCFNGIHAPSFDWAMRNYHNAQYISIRYTGRDYETVNNAGFPLRSGGHSFAFWLPGKYFAAHPEYFSLINGKRTGYKENDYAEHVQLNVGNKDLQDLVAKRMLEYLKQYPGCDTLALVMNDGGNWGDSPEERAFDDPDEYSRKVYSTRYFRFVNIIAEKVCSVRPDVKIYTLAYLDCEEVPKIEKLHPNVIVGLCTYRRCYKCTINDPTCDTNRRWDNLLRGWSKLSKQIHIYDYLAFGGMPAFPAPVLKVMQKDLQYYHSLGVTGYKTESVVDGGPWKFAGNSKGLGFYRSKPADHIHYWTGMNMIYHLMSRLLWDPYSDLEAMKADYFHRYYGPAAAAMQKINTLIEKRWDDDKSPYVWNQYSTNFPAMLFKPGDFEKVRSWIKEAEKAAAAVPFYSRRVAHFADLVNKVWSKDLGGITKTLYVKESAVIDGGFARFKDGKSVPAESRARIKITLKGTEMILNAEFFQPGSDVVTTYKGRDGLRGYGDTFEIFINAGPKNRKDGYYQFIVGAGGGIYDAKMRNYKWNCSFTAQASVKSDRWCADVKIPLHELGYDELKPGDTIRLNLGHVRQKPYEISSWTDGSLEGQTSFGTIIKE